MVTTITKRDGRVVNFDKERIVNAINKAALSCKDNDGKQIYTEELASGIAESDAKRVVRKLKDVASISVEEIQDLVEEVLMDKNPEIAKEYILYRNERAKERMLGSGLIQKVEEYMTKTDESSDSARDNANIPANQPMAQMLKVGSEVSEWYFINKQISPKFAELHKNNTWHQHDCNFGVMCHNCIQLYLPDLFKDGFSTGHGYLREPKSIRAAGALAAIAIQSQQNQQFGGVSVTCFDFAMAKYVTMSFIQNICNLLKVKCDGIYEETKKQLTKYAEENNWHILSKNHEFDISDIMVDIADEDYSFWIDESAALDIIYTAKELTEKDAYQAMEALVHNLNTLHSRSGSQTPFSSLNYGLDTSEEGRMITKNLLLATEAGLGYGETPIFPIQIFQLKKDVNMEKGTPNYDLFKLACKVSAKRLFPNFLKADVPYLSSMIDWNDIRTYPATMGCRSFLLKNVYKPENQFVAQRGNISFTTINLPKLALLAKGDLDDFMTRLDDVITDVFDQLVERFELLGRRRAKDFPFMYGQGTWIDGKTLHPEDKIRDVLANGSMTVGYCGLAEALVALTGKHHGESEESDKIGYSIIKHMRERCDKESEKRKLNFSLIASPAESTAGSFQRSNRKEFGIIEGVTDREYMTNGNHIPVYYDTTAAHKIDIESKYHALTNGGNILYVELDGDPAQNLEAFEELVKYMYDKNAFYFSINHPVDYCPICHYTGIIGDTCPRCGRHDKEAISEEKFNELHKIYGICGC